MEKRYVITTLVLTQTREGEHLYSLARVSKRTYFTYELAEKFLLKSKETKPERAYSIMPIYIKPNKP